MEDNIRQCAQSFRVSQQKHSLVSSINLQECLEAHETCCCHRGSKSTMNENKFTESHNIILQKWIRERNPSKNRVIIVTDDEIKKTEIWKSWIQMNIQCQHIITGVFICLCVQGVLDVRGSCEEKKRPVNELMQRVDWDINYILHQLLFKLAILDVNCFYFPYCQLCAAAKYDRLSIDRLGIKVTVVV